MNMKNFKIHPNTKIGENSKIGDYTIIGEPPRGREIGQLKTIIGRNAIIRSHTVIYAGTRIGDDFETLEKGLDFLLRYNGTAELRTIRPVTPYPGSPLYFEAIERGLLRGPAEFYETRHVNSDLLTINFTDLSDDQFHEALGKANDELIAAYHMNKRKDALYHARNFYQTKDANFRGFRAV